MNYFDIEQGQLSQIGVYSTPLGAIVAQEVKLDEKVAVTSVERGSAFIALTTIDTEEPGRGTLTLVFSEQPLGIETMEGQGCTRPDHDHRPRRWSRSTRISIRDLFVFHDPNRLDDSLGR